tara:strand:+ start:432 stop:1079 length:648 start_codon:yes stop_codon:yes gene_type:complete
MFVEDRFKNFVLVQMKNLEAYDGLRPANHPYEFHHHSERVAKSMRSLALKTGYTESMADTLYWATLPHDIGKMSLPVEIWDLDERPTQDQREERRSHTILGLDIVRQNFADECDKHPFLRLLCDIMANHHESMDGSGYIGKDAAELSREVRMACICDAFDGWSVRRAGFDPDRDLSPKGVIHRMETEKTGQFDREILKSFKEMKLCTSKSYSPLL